MRLAAAASLCAMGFLLCPAPVHAQAAAEFGAAAGNAAGMSGAASGIGKALSGLAGTQDKTVKSESTPAPSSSTTTRKSPAKRPAVSRAKAAAPAKTYEDPKNLAVGLTYTDMVRRFGPASMEFATATGKSLTYASKEGMTQVEIRDGAVASITRP